MDGMLLLDRETRMRVGYELEGRIGKRRFLRRNCLGKRRGLVGSNRDARVKLRLVGLLWEAVGGGSSRGGQGMGLRI